MSEALLIPLSDIADINPPRKTLQLADTDEVSFIPMSDVTDNARWLGNQTRLLREVRSGYTYFEEGDVLFAKITPCTENGKGCLAVGLKNGIGFGSTEFHVLRAKPNSDPRFIFQWTIAASLRSQAAAQMIGSAGQQRVPEDFLSRFQIPALRQSEQTAIADILTTLDRAIAQTEALIAKQRRIKAGLLHDLLTRGIDEQGNLRHPSTHRFKTSPVGLVPEEWEVRALSDILHFPSGQIDPRYLPYSQWPLVAPDHIESGTGRLLNVQTAAEQGAISGKYCFMPEDVVYSKIRPYLRKAILAQFQGLCSADMYPLRPTPRITSAYLLMVILGEHFSRFAEAVSERSGFPKINRSEMSEYILSLPEVAEQLRIGEVLSIIDDLQVQSSLDLTKLHRLKIGLMHDLLSGRVSVAGLV